MSLTCTLTIQTQTGSMASGIPPTTTTFSRRYTRAQSSPMPPQSTSSPCSSNNSSPSASRLSISSSTSQSDKIAESVSKLAALPSLSKSLNNLPSLAGQTGKEIPVYEGMPSRAQKSSHEKLKTALGNSANSKFAQEKNGLVSSYDSVFALGVWS
ncbi:hypothetical protein FRC00_010779 [Tulasnella sp. 408]|nr:hypothetical protein FRC00_010779 [Tulasnella sp. 408]